MSEGQAQVSSRASEHKFKERVTAIIGVGILVVAGILSLVAAYVAATGDNGFADLKDLLTFWSGLVGAAGGYYFGRVGVENRAEAAESTMQVAQTAWTEAERQAARAVARLDVENLARGAAEKARDLAEEAQVKAEQVAQMAQEAKEVAEAKMDQMKETVTEVTQGVQDMRDRFQTFKDGMAQIGEATGLGSLVLGAEAEGEAPPVDMQALDSMSADMDVLLAKLEQMQS